jgi:hypothetical protein
LFNQFNYYSQQPPSLPLMRTTTLLLLTAFKVRS